MIAWQLAAASIFWGLGAFGVFSGFTDHAALKNVLRHLYAHLLGIRLYSEEPALVFREQKALILDNLRFLRLLAKPLLITALSFALLYGHLDSFFGWGPLRVGQSATVTLQLSGEASYTLRTPPGIAVETLPVVVPADHQISWRIRALAPMRGSLRFVRLGSGDILSPVATGEWSAFCCQRRESLPGGLSVEVDYPRVVVAMAGFDLPWLVWFLIISTTSAAVAALTRLFAPALHPPTMRQSPSS